jgi:hypothetical protein
MTMALSNSSQQYDILSITDSTLMFVMTIFCVLIPVSYFPFSPRPDKVFLRLLVRFFRSSEYLMNTMRWNLTMTPTRLDRWKRAFYTRELAALPQKLGGWGKIVNTGVLSETTPEQLQVLAVNLQALAGRMQELMDARADLHADLLAHELLIDVSDWHLKIQEDLSGFSQGLTVASVNKLCEQLTVSLAHLEIRIENTLNKEGGDKFSILDEENLYRLLGAYRGLSDALIEYAETAKGIGWEQWRESRF